MNIGDTEKHESCVVKGLCVCSITQLFVDWQKRRQKKQKPTQKSDLAYTSSISLSFPQNLWKLFETKLLEGWNLTMALKLNLPILQKLINFWWQTFVKFDEKAD